MWSIYYDLFNSATCGGMAPEYVGDGEFGQATLPEGMAMSGIYVIWNAISKNRYVGISNNIKDRFKGRLEVITEMGFDSRDLNNICIFWGSVYVWNDNSEILRWYQQLFNGRRNMVKYGEKPCSKCSNTKCQNRQQSMFSQSTMFNQSTMFSQPSMNFIPYNIREKDFWCIPELDDKNIVLVSDRSMKVRLVDSSASNGNMAVESPVINNQIGNNHNNTFLGNIQLSNNPLANIFNSVESSPSKVEEVDLERLLIRYFLKKYGDGGTLSNNMKAKDYYVNKTGKDVMVYVAWDGKHTHGDRPYFTSSAFDAATWNVDMAW